jgi:hypothetical protein
MTNINKETPKDPSASGVDSPPVNLPDHVELHNLINPRTDKQSANEIGELME